MKVYYCKCLLKYIHTEVELLYYGGDNSTTRHHMPPKKKHQYQELVTFCLIVGQKISTDTIPPNIAGQSYRLSSTAWQSGCIAEDTTCLCHQIWTNWADAQWNSPPLLNSVHNSRRYCIYCWEIKVICITSSYKPCRLQ